MTINYIQQTLDTMIKFVTNGEEQSQSILKKVNSDWLNSNNKIVDLTGETVQWLDEAAYEAEQNAAIALQQFKASREQLIKACIVTVNGFKFDADRNAILNMMAKCAGNQSESDTLAIQWSLADTATGVMTQITLGDLRQALKLATDYVDSIWGIN